MQAAMQLATPHSTKRKARILVVDDDPGLLRLLTIRLRAENYEVEAVESAALALAATSRFRPELVITDLRMDQMDGIGLLKELQSRYPGLKVIILTAHGTIPDAVHATQLGAFGFLTKPVDKQELLDQVQKALKISGFVDSDEDWRSEIITRSSLVEEKLSQAHMVAGTDAACSSRANPAPARNCWPRPSTTPARAAPSRSSPSTARRWREPARVRAVRPHQGVVHRCGARSPGTVPGRRRRHAAARRDRRHADAPAGEAAARPAGEQHPPDRRHRCRSR
jgi:FixJ family two-component response regulator